MSNIVIPDGGNIGSASDTDAISISSSGAVTLSSDFVPATPLSHRNLIINGAMQVAQRATSSGASSGYNNIDRFRWSGGNHTSMAGTIAQVAVTDLAGFSNCLKYTVTTEESSISANEYWWMHTRIESQDLQCLSYGTSNAKTCTLSFYVRCSIAGTYAVSIIKSDVTTQQFGGTYTVSSTQASNSTSSAGWQRVSITIPPNTAQGIDNNNGIGFDIYWVLFAGSDYTGTDNTSWVNLTNGAYAYGHSTTMGTVNNSTWEITGIQLELGSQSTPFEHRTFSDELRRCQRYCVVYGDGTNGAGEWILNGAAPNTTTLYANYLLPVLPRSTPTVSCSGLMRISDNFDTDNTANPPSIGTQPNTQSSFTSGGRVYLTGFSGLTTGRNYGSGRESGEGKTTFEMEL